MGKKAHAQQQASSTKSVPAVSNEDAASNESADERCVQGDVLLGRTDRRVRSLIFIIVVTKITHLLVGFML